MTYTRDDYYQECFETAMSDEGLWNLVEMMSDKQRANIGGAIAGAVENENMAFYRPESPYPGEIATLKRQLAWERARITCGTCKGAGRERYNMGPWAVDTQCGKCNGDGKVHPHREPRPA